MSEVLFLAHRVPYPPDRGDRIRSWNILKGIAALAPVHVCALSDEGDAGRTEIEAVAASCHIEKPAHSRLGAMARALATGQPASVCACASPVLAAWVEMLLATRPITAIYAFSGQMAQFVPRDFAGRFVMDFVDMDSAKFKAFGGFANDQEAKRLFAFEKAIARRADVSLFVSEAEAALFRRETGLGANKVGVLENGVDLGRFDPAMCSGEGRSVGAIHPALQNGATLRLSPEHDCATPLIVFTGQMDYRPNIEAVAAFARETMPLILAARHDATFAIVGRAPSADVLALAQLPGVNVTGEVSDTREWIAAADVVVAPLKLARGIQNKVLEAMAMAKAVVVSSAAAEGIDATPGSELLVANGRKDEAAAVLRLLTDPAEAKAIGEAARVRMIARYSWGSRLADLPAILGMEA